MGAPVTAFSTLSRADGSATYSQSGYTVVAAVNGPIEVQRRDELPEEAAIEVNVRPAAGVGLTRERHLETLIHNTLRRIILTNEHPRTLVQVTLQVLSTPEQTPKSYKLNPISPLRLLPTLLHASLLALLSAAIPLSTTFTATLAAASTSPKPRIFFPDAEDEGADLSAVDSLHVLAFTADRGLLLAESEGGFEMEQWDEVCQMAEVKCCGEEDDEDESDEDDEDEGMQEEGTGVKVKSLKDWLKGAVRTKAEADVAWRQR